MINLVSTENQHQPLFRILVMPPGRWSDARQPWEILPSPPRWDIYGSPAGYDLLRCRRVVLPDLGQAQFRYRFGKIDNRLFGINSIGGARDLAHYAVRIQTARAPSLVDVYNGNYDEADLDWRTIWVGTVEHQADSMVPAKSILSGDRIYHCEDILGVTKRWQMTSHGYEFVAGVGVCRNNPGYNTRDGDGALSGNRSDQTLTFFDDDTTTSYAHTIPGQGNVWLDFDAVKNALVSSRAIGEPRFTLFDPCGLLGGQEVWEVNESDRCFEFLRRVMPRQRGRGLAYASWTESDPLGNLSLYLTVNAQSKNNITFTNPAAGGTTTILGAAATGTTVNIDLQGDHRVIPETFQVGERSQHQVGYLESVGERIEVVTTVGYPDNLFEEKWPIAVGANFDALDPSKRIGDKWDLAYHLHGLKPTYLFVAGNGNGSGTNHVLDYLCVNGGIGEVSSSVLPESSLAVTDILDSLPIPTQPVSGAKFTRKPPLLLMRFTDFGSDRFYDGRRHLGLELHIREDGILVAKPDWDDAGYRFVGDKSIDNHQAAYNYTELSLTCALRLPHRIMYTSGDRETAGRRLILPPAKDMRLWLVSKDAITGLDLEDAGSGIAVGYPPIRNVEGTDVPGANYRILRDDRDRLARRHFQAWSWYGAARQTLYYQMKACVLESHFEVEDERGNRSNVTYPQLGNLVDQLTAAGQVQSIQTPITAIDYNHETGVSTIETDWSDLDLTTK